MRIPKVDLLTVVDDLDTGCLFACRQSTVPSVSSIKLKYVPTEAMIRWWRKIIWIGMPMSRGSRRNWQWEILCQDWVSMLWGILDHIYIELPVMIDVRMIFVGGAKNTRKSTWERGLFEWRWLTKTMICCALSNLLWACRHLSFLSTDNEQSPLFFSADTKQ